MASRVKSAADAAKKWSTRAQGAGGDYTSGVSNAGQAWHDATVRSGDTWAAGVQAAVGQGRFAKGVERAGANRYQTRAANDGGQRYTQGVAGAQDQYQARVGKFLDVINTAKQALPMRRPKGDPANWARSQAIGQALHQAKLQG